MAIVALWRMECSLWNEPPNVHGEVELQMQSVFICTCVFQDWIASVVRGRTALPAGRQSKHRLVDARPDSGRSVLTRCSGLSALRVMCCVASGEEPGHLGQPMLREIWGI